MSQQGGSMYCIKFSFLAVFLAVSLSAPVAAAPLEEVAPEVRRVSVPLTYENRPVTLQAALPTGSIIVQGADFSEVLIEVSTEGERVPVPDGMRRTPAAGGGLEVREHENLVVLKVPWGSRPTWKRSARWSASAAASASPRSTPSPRR